jgi:hypothetical protein
MNIFELGPPDDQLLDDHNYVYYPTSRRYILLTIVIIFTTCFILISLTSIFLFIFTKNQQHSLSSIQDGSHSTLIRGNLRIKIGEIFGNSSNDSAFDDSLIENFTTSHYLRGIILRMDSDCLGWIQCFYSSDSHSDDILRGITHGIREQTDVGEQFWLDNDEKVFKVQIKVDYVQLFKDGRPSMKPRIIRNLRFFTTNKRSTPKIDQFGGEMYTEEFEGYTLGYLTGTSSRYIDQLQFYWYQTINN